ncbi:hypothetical protein ACX3TR_01330 [Aerococcus mictus]
MEREQLVRNRLLQLELHFKSIRYFDRRKDKQLESSLLFSDQRPNELIIIYCKEGFLTIILMIKIILWIITAIVLLTTEPI